MILPEPAHRIRLSARARAERALARVHDLAPAELGRIFTRLDPALIRAAAVEADTAAEAGAHVPLHGLTVSIKDLFDEAGEVTGAGSTVLLSAAPAAEDAPAVARLKAAGAVPFGRTTMTEFAYSGIGLNPHYGTCGNAADPHRIPGGSTSGGAVAAARGLCDVALGSDTGGSVRVPAALNGLAGFKSSQAAVPRAGVFPLSGSFDSVGPLAADIETCAAAHAVLSGTEGRIDPLAGVRGLRVGALQGFWTDGLDAAVAGGLQGALDTLSQAGAEIEDAQAPFLEVAGRCNRVIVACEAHAIHAGRMAALEAGGDPLVLRRLRFAETVSEEQEAEARALRAEAVAGWRRLCADYDVLVAPTVATVAPLLWEAHEDFDRLNGLMLRNTGAINFADGCAATLPMQAAGELPTGLMVCAAPGADWRCLDIAARIELLVARPAR